MATLQQITANDIASWDSLSDVASTLEKRGLKIRENLGEANELVLQLTDREFIVLVEAGPGESASISSPTTDDVELTSLPPTTTRSLPSSPEFGRLMDNNTGVLNTRSSRSRRSR